MTRCKTFCFGPDKASPKRRTAQPNLHSLRPRGSDQVRVGLVGWGQRWRGSVSLLLCCPLRLPLPASSPCGVVEAFMSVHLLEVRKRKRLESSDQSQPCPERFQVLHDLSHPAGVSTEKAVKQNRKEFTNSWTLRGMYSRTRAANKSLKVKRYSEPLDVTFRILRVAETWADSHLGPTEVPARVSDVCRYIFWLLIFRFSAASSPPKRPLRAEFFSGSFRQCNRCITEHHSDILPR